MKNISLIERDLSQVHRFRVAAIVVGALVVTALMAQTAPGNQELADADLSATVKVSPRKAGTKQNPRGVTVSAVSTITTPRGLEPPILTGIDLLLGQGFSWNQDEYVTCSRQALDLHGLDGCPRESVMGDVVTTARAGTVQAKPDATLVNGDANKLFAYTRYEYPARVGETIVMTTTAMAGRWRYKGTLRVPEGLQVLAGMPIHTTRMKLTIGGKPYAKDYITTTSCPKGGWKYQATAHYRYDQTGQTDQDTVSGTIPCTR